jgi:hypothetical protein
MITRKTVTDRLAKYLDGEITLEELVSWAEGVLMREEPLDEDDAPVLREAIGRLGLADVREFGLSWQDVESILERLGYHAHVIIKPT